MFDVEILKFAIVRVAVGTIDFYHKLKSTPFLIDREKSASIHAEGFTI